jgi:hypothetical protein
VTTVPLDLPVARNTIRGLLAADLMAVSGDVGAGSPPVRVVGPSNPLSIPVGNAMAGGLLPADGDGGQGRHGRPRDGDLQDRGGRKGTVAVKLNRRGKKLLARPSRMTVAVRLTPKGGAATTAKLTLGRPRVRS